MSSILSFQHTMLSVKSLNDEDKIRYLLTLENETTSKIEGKYTYLMFQKRKDILHSKYNFVDAVYKGLRDCQKRGVVYKSAYT